uniref:Uncharacterized protein n=1 Tax=Daphnia magna TaxID=35525 RepID=A0A0P5BFR9_9CRUS
MFCQTPFRPLNEMELAKSAPFDLNVAIYGISRSGPDFCGKGYRSTPTMLLYHGSSITNTHRAGNFSVYVFTQICKLKNVSSV